MKRNILNVFYGFVAVLMLFKNHWEKVLGLSIGWPVILLLGGTVFLLQMREHLSKGTIKPYIATTSFLLLALLVMIYFQLKP